MQEEITLWRQAAFFAFLRENYSLLEIWTRVLTFSDSVISVFSVVGGYYLLTSESCLRNYVFFSKEKQ